MKRFLSALVFCAALYPASAQVTTTDSLALVSLYNSTNGGAWTNRTNWLQPALVGSWYGITVSGGRVTEINLPTNNLNGSLPNLSDMTALKRLDLSFNRIFGSLPSTVNNLVSLEHLNVRNNLLSGTIPGLSSLVNLKYLSLGTNFTSQAAFPAFLFSLANLEHLILDNTRLFGDFPSSGWAGLPQLKELNLASNTLFFSGFPGLLGLTELGSLSNLEIMNLQGISLANTSLAPLTGLTNLQNLNVSSTSLNTLPAGNSWASDSLAINITNNLLDFGDLEPYAGLPNVTLINSAQGSLPFSTIAGATIKLLAGDPFHVVGSFGGTQNTYAWNFNNVVIPGETSQSLNLGSVDASDAGGYRLQMTNALFPGLTINSVTLNLSVFNRVESYFELQQALPITQETASNSYGGYWADIDSDGDEDLLLNNTFDTNPNFLYQNNGDGTFTKVTTGDIVTNRDPSRYVSWGDYDNNGYPDLFAGDYTGADNISSLYQNNGNGTFNRIVFNHNADGGLWADYDNDGDLDISVMTTSSQPVNNRLYKNKGDGTFEAIDNFVPFSSTWVAGWVDMDNDNDLDYFLTDQNVSPTNIRLFKNDQGIFTAATVSLPTGNFSVRSISWADIDGDGDQDFFAENSNGAINSTAESQFYINDGTGQFTRQDASLRMGGLRVTGARGTVFGDADNDGDLDLFVNHKHLTTSNDLIVQLFLNNGSGFFTVVPVTEQSFGFSDFGTNMSMADYDNNGSLDLIIANFDWLMPNYLFKNLQGANGNHWIKLRLVGTISNKSAIGARVDIYSGGNRRTRQVLSSSGLSGQNSLLVHAGLGASTQADSVIIYWPSGIVQRLFNLGGDQTVIIEETNSTPEQNSSNIVFSNVTTNSMRVTFTPGTGTSRLVIARPISAVSFQPSDSSTYTLGQMLDSANFVMYVGDSTHFDATNLLPYTDYFLEFFEVNLVGGFPKYKKPGATATQKTLPSALSQFITSTPIPFKSVGEAPFAINATSSSGLPLQFTSTNPAVATLVNNTVWVWGAGTTTIVMTQPGNDSYSAAPEVTQELTVYPAEDLNVRLVTTMQLGGSQGHGTIIAVNASGSDFQLLHEFDSTEGFKPAGQLLPLANGFLYGTNTFGGAFNRGTIYRIKPDGTEFSTLHVFDIANGGQPFAGLIQASDGALYGSCANGGPDNFGVIYKINPDGSGFTKLHDFIGTEGGYSPYGRLLQATNGFLYGTTVDGGANFGGTLFRIRTDGSGFETLHSFDELGGTAPFGGLYQAANGRLYGAAYGGGGIGETIGTVFRIELDGSAYTKLHTFDNGEDGRNPLYGGYLTQGRDGSLFGTTHSGQFNGGTVFRLTNDSTFSTVRALPGTIGSGVVGAPVIGPDGTLYAQALYAGLGFGSIFGTNQEGAFTSVPLLMNEETGYYPFLTSPVLTYTFKESQTIAWDSLTSPVNLGIAPIYLTATTSSGLTPEYLSSNTSVAVVNGDSLRIVGVGSSVITAFHPGNSQYKPTDSVSHPITVVDNLVKPTIAATNLVFSNVFSTQLDISFTPGDGEKHLVAIKAGSPFTWEPVDGEQYYASAYLPNAPGYGDEARIISIDSSTSIHVTGLDPGVTWYVKVFEYNGKHYPKYLVTNAPSGSRSTLALPNVYVVAPADSATGIYVTTNVTSRSLAGATTYTIQLSPFADFIADVTEKSGTRTQNFSDLYYDTTYYSRVKTDLSPDFGPTRSFRTGPPEQFSYVTSPANNATGVTLTNLSRSVTMNNVIGATTYTCELNTTSNFDGISQVKTGARTQTFTGLSPGTTYYSRVHTDLSPNTWGPTRQFSTAGASLLTWVSSPANNAVNVSYQPNVTVTNVGATSYTVQLSPTSDFTVNVLEQTSPTRTMSFTGLAYNTQYYSRARTELDSAWGPLRSFTTTSPLAYSYMTSPANNAVNVNYVVNISANTVPGATTYFIEANTLPDFSGTSIVRSGARTQNFTLAPNQLYYVRVSTDLLPGQYGVIRSFTTISSLAFSYITSPANGATNVPYVTNITAYNVPLATSFIIEANTLPDFTGTSIVKMGTVRTYSFTLAHDQVYYVRVQTNLAPGEWGLYRSFTTGSPQSLAYVTSPANGVVGVPTTVNVTSNLVPGATSYTIELNPEEFFTGTPIIRTGAGRTKNFTGLSENRTYYSRVSTSLTPGVWGPTRSFTTVNPGGRQAGEVWVESTDEDPLVPDEITEVTIFPNPFTDQFDIHVQTTDQQPLEAQLLDMNGRTVFEARDWMTNRLHTVKGEFSPGIYLLELNTEGTRRVMRVVRR